MPLEQHPLDPSELPIFSSIMEEAFASGIGPLLYPDPSKYTQESREHTYAMNHKAMQNNPDTIRFFKIIDTSLDASTHRHAGIVAVSEWKIFPNSRSEEELAAEEAEAATSGLPPGMDPKFAEAFFGQLAVHKRKNLGGKPFMLLHILAVAPDQHRKGVGKTAMWWGVEEADRRDLPLYLESSPAGKGLYERFGFGTVSWLDFDAREFGAETALAHACMLRPKRSERGVE